MKLRIEIPDADEDDDWVCHRELPLARLSDSVPELSVAYDQSVELPSGEALHVSAHYGKHNGLCWIMVNEAGTQKASIEARNNDPPPRLVFTTSEGTSVRLTVVK